MGGRQVLELVHEQEATGALGGPPCLGIGEEELDGADDLLVEVDGASAGELGPVLGDVAAKPGDLAVVGRFDVGRGAEPEPGRRRALRARSRADRCCAVLGSLTSRPRIRRTSASSMVVRCLGPGRERSLAVEDRQTEGVERADLQAGEVRGALLHLLLGALVERHEAQRGRRQAPAVEQQPGPLGEDAGLARTGRGDDAGRTAGVTDGGELVVGECGRRGVGPEGAQGAVLEGHGGHDGAERVERAGVAQRPSVAPRGATVGEHDVAGVVAR